MLSNFSLIKSHNKTVPCFLWSANVKSCRWSCRITAAASPAAPRWTRVTAHAAQNPALGLRHEQLQRLLPQAQTVPSQWRRCLKGFSYSNNHLRNRYRVLNLALHTAAALGGFWRFPPAVWGLYCDRCRWRTCSKSLCLTAVHVQPRSTDPAAPAASCNSEVTSCEMPFAYLIAKNSTWACDGCGAPSHVLRLHPLGDPAELPPALHTCNPHQGRSLKQIQARQPGLQKRPPPS